MMLRETIDNQELNNLPRGEFSGTIKVIDTPAQIEQVIPEIVINKVLGFDTETKPAFKKGSHHEVSLLQLSNNDTAWLFRLHLSGFSPSLAKLMAEPSIVKVGAAILDDVRGLKKLRPFVDKGFVDLQKMVEAYGVKEKGVKKMAGIFLDMHISKRQRLTNWETSELTEAQLRYAATDAWVCLEIYQKMLSIQKS